MISRFFMNALRHLQQGKPFFAIVLLRFSMTLLSNLSMQHWQAKRTELITLCRVFLPFPVHCKRS